MLRMMTGALIFGLCIMLVGCGGGGGPAEAPQGGESTTMVGSLEVTTQATAGFKTLALPSPATSPISMNVLYGAKITGLRELRKERLAFQSGRDGNQEIYSCNSDGSEQTNVTNNPAADERPSFSPDGKKIAFDTSRDGNFEIYTMNAGGSGLLRLTNNAVFDFAAAWSPDGKQIAFVSQRDGSNEIYVMNVNGSSQTRLTNNAVFDSNPKWSPDGRRIAFESSRDGNVEIYTMNADGTAQTRLTDSGPAADQNPAWSPDGQSLAFATARDGNFEIYTMFADGSSPTRITNTPATEFGPVWSPDGSRIAFASNAAGADDIYALDLTAKLPTRLTTTPGSDQFPDWLRGAAIFRTFIGANGSDGGSNPPFGTERVLTVMGLKAHEGVVSAAALSLTAANFASVKVAAQAGGNSLIGLKITATSITSIIEDTGRGRPIIPWTLSSPATGAVLVYFAADTGRIDTVIASSDVAISSAPESGEIQSQSANGRVTLRGHFTAAYDARNPQANLISQSAQQIVLDARTGQVLAAQ